MAGDWIKMRQSLGGDPDVIQIAAKLSLDEFGVVGRLHAVWSWLDQHSDDGTNVRIVSAFLDRITACPGFSDAMRLVGWLDGQDGALSFPGYSEHNGETAKRRATETKRKKGQRTPKLKRDKCPAIRGTNVPHVVPQSPGPEKRREDSITGEPVPPKSTQPHIDLIESFRTAYTVRFGSPPIFQKRNLPSAQEALAAGVTVDQVREKANQAWDSTSEFIRQQGMEFHSLWSIWNKLNTSSTPPRTKGQQF